MRTLDLAQLYLRIVIGGMLLLHNIDKQQHYNEIIDSYPSMDGIGGATWFLLFSVVESVAAVMLIVGWRIRLASTALILGTIIAMTLYFPQPSTVTLELRGIYVFLYIYIFIAGGGLYSLDQIRDTKIAK